jgi:hypothetical protein
VLAVRLNYSSGFYAGNNRNIVIEYPLSTGLGGQSSTNSNKTRTYQTLWGLLFALWQAGGTVPTKYPQQSTHSSNASDKERNVFAGDIGPCGTLILKVYWLCKKITADFHNDSGI